MTSSKVETDRLQLHNHSASALSMHSTAQPKKQLGLDNLVTHLRAVGHEVRSNDIESTYNNLQDLLNEMESLQTAMMQKHEADFVAAYKDHMLKVQFELIQFQKKSSQFYQDVKKNEKIQTLEKSLEWLRTESVKLSEKVEHLEQRKKKLETDLKQSQEECAQWRKIALNTKSYNVVLQKTVRDLKSPALINKYEELGRSKAESEFKSLLKRDRQQVETETS